MNTTMIRVSILAVNSSVNRKVYLRKMANKMCFFQMNHAAQSVSKHLYVHTTTSTCVVRIHANNRKCVSVALDMISHACSLFISIRDQLQLTSPSAKASSPFTLLQPCHYTAWETEKCTCADPAVEAYHYARQPTDTHCGLCRC